MRDIKTLKFNVVVQATQYISCRLDKWRSVC